MFIMANERKNFSDMVKMVVEETGLSEEKTRKVLNSFLNNFVANIEKGNTVSINKLGVFNLATFSYDKVQHKIALGKKEKVSIDSKYVKFKNSRTLKNYLNGKH